MVLCRSQTIQYCLWVFTIHAQTLNVAQSASILGATNLASLSVTGAIASQSLGVTGTSALGQTSIMGVLAQASGNVTLGGSVSVSSTLTVARTLTANNPVQINNNSLTMMSTTPTLVLQGSSNTSASIYMSSYNYGTYAPPYNL